MTPDAAEMEERIEAEDLNHVFVEITDMHGVARSLQVSADHFLETWQDGFAMNMLILAATPRTDIAEGTGYGEEINCADGLIYPIPETFKLLPWRDDAAAVTCRYEFDGQDVGAYPRYVLRRVLDRLPSDYDLFVGSELEFFLLDPTENGYEPATGHKHECVSWATEAVAPFYDKLSAWATEYGVPIDVMHHEFGAGQLEALFDYGRPLRQADRTFDFKRLVDQTARTCDQLATFMAKPFTGGSGNGYHIHVSAFDEGRNAFADDSGSLSQAGRYFVGGLLEHSEALAAIQTPTLNGYKRYEPGSFAPATVSWGYNNRMATLRVPGTGTTRIENRLGSADANPYLAIAATLAAGFDGLEREIEPTEPVDGDPAGRRPPLPSSFELALRALETDDVLRDTLGEEFIHVYTTVKREELDGFYDHVTQWERDQYIEML